MAADRLRAGDGGPASGEPGRTVADEASALAMGARIELRGRDACLFFEYRLDREINGLLAYLGPRGR